MPGIPNRIALSLAVFGLLTLAEVQRASAQLENSAWNSFYGQYQGPATSARIQFQGPQATYSTPNGNGSLSNVTYYRDQNTGAVTAITGNWSFAGQNGWYQFSVQPDGQSFSGKWGYGGYQPGAQANGSWNGTRIGGPMAPPGGPVPPPGGPIPPP